MTPTFKGKKIIHHEPKDYIPEFPVDFDKVILQGNTAELSGDILPVILTWRFQIFDDGKQVFSFIANHFFTFSFLKGENPIDDIKGIIEGSHNLFLRHLFKAAWNMDIEEKAIPFFNETIKENKAKEITAIAKKLLLL